jgi:hypothetical protein
MCHALKMTVFNCQAWEMTDLEEQSKLPAMQRAVPVTVNHAIMVKNPYFSGGAYQKVCIPLFSIR